MTNSTLLHMYVHAEIFLKGIIVDNELLSSKHFCKGACTQRLYVRFNSHLTRFGVQNAGDYKFLESPGRDQREA